MRKTPIPSVFVGMDFIHQHTRLCIKCTKYCIKMPCSAVFIFNYNLIFYYMGYFTCHIQYLSIKLTYYKKTICLIFKVKRSKRFI